MTQVENLLNLYRVDGQVRGLRRRLDAAEHHLQIQNRQLKESQDLQQELQTRRRHLEAAIANVELELKSVDERLEKYRNDLNSSVTNKQYSAVLSELNTVKASRSEIEDRLLQNMEQLEKIQEQLTETDAQLIEKSRLCELARTQLDERKADVGQRLSELESERTAAAAVIASDVLAIFDEVADLHDGEAMATIEEVSRRHREYVCGVCNMHIPFDHIVGLTAKSDAIIRCSSCTRILYMQEEVRGSLVKK